MLVRNKSVLVVEQTAGLFNPINHIINIACVFALPTDVAFDIYLFICFIHHTMCTQRYIIQYNKIKIKPTYKQSKISKKT